MFHSCLHWLHIHALKIPCSSSERTKTTRAGCPSSWVEASRATAKSSKTARGLGTAPPIQTAACLSSWVEASGAIEKSSRTTRGFGTPPPSFRLTPEGRGNVSENMQACKSSRTIIGALVPCKSSWGKIWPPSSPTTQLQLHLCKGHLFRWRATPGLPGGLRLFGKGGNHIPPTLPRHFAPRKL